MFAGKDRGQYSPLANDVCDIVNALTICDIIDDYLTHASCIKPPFDSIFAVLIDKIDMNRDIKFIAVHCTASTQKTSVATLLNEFKARGWKQPGYHYVVCPDGKVEQLLREESTSNGVKGFNSISINVAYIGGVTMENGKLKAVDNRTDAQKASLIKLLKELRGRYPKATIQGHRDFSPDTNGNGIIDPWERIKECPCFDAKIEYKDI